MYLLYSRNTDGSKGCTSILSGVFVSIPNYLWCGRMFLYQASFLDRFDHTSDLGSLLYTGGGSDDEGDNEDDDEDPFNQEDEDGIPEIFRRNNLWNSTTFVLNSRPRSPLDFSSLQFDHPWIPDRTRTAVTENRSRDQASDRRVREQRNRTSRGTSWISIVESIERLKNSHILRSCSCALVMLMHNSSSDEAIQVNQLQWGFRFELRKGLNVSKRKFFMSGFIRLFFSFALMLLLVLIILAFVFALYFVHVFTTLGKYHLNVWLSMSHFLNY